MQCNFKITKYSYPILESIKFHFVLKFLNILSVSVKRHVEKYIHMPGMVVWVWNGTSTYLVWKIRCGQGHYLVRKIRCGQRDTWEWVCCKAG